MGDGACLQLGGDNDGSTPRNSYRRLEKFQVRMDRMEETSPRVAKTEHRWKYVGKPWYIRGGRSNQR